MEAPRTNDLHVGGAILPLACHPTPGTQPTIDDRELGVVRLKYCRRGVSARSEATQEHRTLEEFTE
jgi:hypothetical protein